jgi:rhodanese-related sulfurtransferase
VAARAHDTSAGNERECGRQAPVEVLLERARRRLVRLTAVEAHAAMQQGAVLVDIRSDRQRDHDGGVPAAVFIPRNVLEWRADPESAYFDARLAQRHGPLIVMCAEGYQSSLAAATLQELGIHDATDLIDGFNGWLAARLPIQAGQAPA